MASASIHPYLTESDLVVLDRLFRPATGKAECVGDTHKDTAMEHQPAADLASKGEDADAVGRLQAMNDPSSKDFAPSVFSTWDKKDIPPWIQAKIVEPYTSYAIRVVRHPTDVVFLTHIMLYLTVNLPSAIYLFYDFHLLHGLAHIAFTFWCSGAFTLLMHNHIHNNGVLAKEWYWLDWGFPYILEPLMGHTWDSYYYHHVKHHHVEGNGPEDLSSTIRYQRDDVLHFLHYVGRFIFFSWLELPIYFIRRRKYKLVIKGSASEIGSFMLIYVLTRYVSAKASCCVLIIPLVLLRFGLMVGNWGQHALVDEVEPDSDFRSSITLIDVPSNRFCFNDGYHTAHHLNPRRHWRDQPVHFLQAKKAYADGRALVFHNIDYIMMTVKLLQKDYMHLASCLVPIGDQIGMSQDEIAAMLRTKTRRFSEEEICRKFGTAGKKIS